MGINHAEPDDPPRDSREAASPSDPAGSPTGSAGRADAVRPSTCGAFGTHAAGLITADTYIEEETPLIGRPWLRYPLARADWALAALLLVAALLVRWPFIAKGETLLHSDEAIVGLMAQDIAAGERFPIYFYGQRYMGALEAYVIAAVSPLFDDQIHALRFGPACFLALLTAVQYLMLTRWFGRRGGLIGAMVLLAASPMFTQWSISARGGYIEGRAAKPIRATCSICTRVCLSALRR